MNIFALRESDIAFQIIDPGQGEQITFCGESGTYLFEGNQYRDTDWLEITVEEQSEITFCTTAEFELRVFLIDGNLGCSDPEVLQTANAQYLEPVYITHDCSPGTYWFWVGPNTFDGWPCSDWMYVVEIDGYVGGSTPPQTETWGAIKTRFR